MKQLFTFIFIAFALVFTYSCDDENNKEFEEIAEKKNDESLKQIRERSMLIAVTDYNSTSYFIYRGEPAGYQYELLKSYARYLGVGLDIVVNNDLPSAFDDLKTGRVDILAMGLTIIRERNSVVDFSLPLSQTKQVLVQRKPENWRKMKTMDEIEKKLIRNPLDLAGKIIYVQRNSSFIPRLKHLSEEIGDSIIVVEFPLDVERLIQMVAEGEIEYTVSDEHIALVNQKYYPDIDVKTAISFPQNIAWAVKKGADSLRLNINKWLEDFIDTKTARFIYNKYFRNPRSYHYAYKYYSVISGNISAWDEIIREKSDELNWDWRLLASLIYQESRFKSDAISWMGAFGLMQLMPGTAELYGVDSFSSPEENIEAGVEYLKSLDERFKDIITDPEERLKFVIAAYNAGPAHIFDARRLARKYNKNPDIWNDNVDYFLLNKSDPKYYNDSVVFYGYCRGKEPFQYVYDIFDRYEHYKNMIE